MTAVEWLIEQLQAPCRSIPSHIVEQAKQMEKAQNVFGHKLVKIYDPVDPKTTIKHHIIDAYNTGYEDRDCNSIKDAEQYYLNKYKPA